jgi:hypothetical protein
MLRWCQARPEDSLKGLHPNVHPRLRAKNPGSCLRVSSDGFSVAAAVSIEPMVKRWRQLTVWLHVLTSAGWMAQAMTLCVLLAVGLTAEDPSVRDSATSMSLVLDDRLLGPMADASAFTGIMLAAATPWGFFRHWWVLTKFAITVVQLYIGIFLLSPVLQHSVAAGPTPRQVAGTALMASAIAFQAWLSIAKPWGSAGFRRLVLRTAGRTQALPAAGTWSSGRRGEPRLCPSPAPGPPDDAENPARGRVRGTRRAPAATGPRWVFVATVLGGLADLALALAIGHPLPLLSVILLTIGLLRRPHWAKARAELR